MHADIEVDQRRIVVRSLGLVEYEPTLHAMRTFTSGRTADTPDEIWLLEHLPVYTLGIATRSAHLPRDSRGIRTVQTDRGGQITYHGPGQAIAYLLLDMKRRRLNVRPLVRLMEHAVINWLLECGIAASSRVEAPGVYVGDAKIGALGLRVTRGCCYHGIALNVDMDLSPFSAIDPCGFAGLAVTQLADLGVPSSVQRVSDGLATHLLELLR
jgi:lipoyl(octanoyl) transferase